MLVCFAFRLFLAIGAVLFVLFAYEFGYRYPIWTLRAFRSPSDSMCPTICQGEHIFAEMQGNNPYVPRQGDVILFRYGPDGSLFIKQVIGLPGDTVAPGPGNAILVNGHTWTSPPVCAKSLRPPAPKDGDSAEVAFPETHVQPGQIFVIGDNLNNSFDSRIEQFEPVRLDAVVGKPALIYFSPSASRIGCPIR